MSALPVNVISDICDQVAAWQDAFIAEASLDRYRRAAACTMSEVAKAASVEASAGIDDAFQDPTLWMRKAFGYTRALTRGGDEVLAELFVKPSQSIVLKYGMGEGPQIRRPGDVGLARDRILVPNWRNLALTQGINRNQYGNVPGGVAARLAREALGQRAKRRVAGRWGVYKGEVDIGGSRIMGDIARPPRDLAPLGKGGRSIVVNIGRPRALLIAIDQASYKPVMQPFYDAAVRDAVNRIPDLMRGELEDATDYRASCGGMRRIGGGS